MYSINLIEKDTDIKSLEMTRYNWDVLINGRPYYVVKIKGYVHSIIGIYNGQNNLWAYPRDEEPTFENLIEFSTKEFGCLWGYRYEPYNYMRTKWDETECFTCHKYIITRNGEDFYNDCHSINEVMVAIQRLKEHPIDFNEIGWKDNVIGKKVWWEGQPAIITNWIDGQACVIIKPDGIDKFKSSEEDIKDDIFSSHISWFRE